MKRSTIISPEVTNTLFIPIKPSKRIKKKSIRISINRVTIGKPYNLLHPTKTIPILLRPDRRHLPDVEVKRDVL